MNLSRLVRRAAAVAVASVTLTASAAAQPITYSFSGSGSGTLGGNSFSFQSFLMTINGDASNVGYQALLASNGILNLGGQIAIDGQSVATFDLPLFVFASNGALGLGNFAQGNLITGVNPAFWSTDLRSNFGPASATNWSAVMFRNVATSAGLLSFSSMSDFTYSSVLTSPVPEPSSLALLATGLLGIQGVRRRRARARTAA